MCELYIIIIYTKTMHFNFMQDCHGNGWCITLPVWNAELHGTIIVYTSKVNTIRSSHTSHTTYGAPFVSLFSGVTMMCVVYLLSIISSMFVISQWLLDLLSMIRVSYSGPPIVYIQLTRVCMDKNTSTVTACHLLLCVISIRRQIHVHSS